MERHAVQPSTVDGSTQGECLSRRKAPPELSAVAIPAKLWISLFEPRSNAADARDLDEKSKRQDRSSLDMDGLGRVVRQKLIDIFEWAPNTLRNGEEHRDLLRGTQQVVVTTAGQ